MPEVIQNGLDSHLHVGYGISSKENEPTSENVLFFIKPL